MKAKILIIEDEEEIARLIEIYLNKDGIEAVLCQTAESGLLKLKESKFDLIVLDINLPGMDGFEFLEVLRKESSIPVIIVTARKADEDVILGLGIGADAFVVKPFSPKVLIARIRAILRRANSNSQSKVKLISFSDFSLDPESYILLKKGKKVPLTSKEFELLRFLVLNAGKTFTSSAIYEKVWGNKFGDLATIAIHIQRIRKKLEEDTSKPVFIINVYGAGYCFNKSMLTSNSGGDAL